MKVSLHHTTSKGSCCSVIPFFYCVTYCKSHLQTCMFAYLFIYCYILGRWQCRCTQRANNASRKITHDYSTASVGNIITFVVTKYITKYAIKTGNITQVTLLTDVMRYLSKIVIVTSLILCNIITTSNEVTNLVSNSLCNA